MNKSPLVIALTLALAGAAGASAPADPWTQDPHFDPDHGPLAAPRTDSHPVDVMIFLARHGVESAQATLAEWEADPAWRDRLYQRDAYRQYRSENAAVRLQEMASREDSKTDRAAERGMEGPGSGGQVAASAQASEVELDFSAELSRLRGEIRVLTADRDELAARLAALEAEHLALKAEHEQLQIAHRALEEEHEVVLSHNELLTQMYAQLQEHYSALHAEYAALRSQVGSGAVADRLLVPSPADTGLPPSPGPEARSIEAMAREEQDTVVAPGVTPAVLVESEEAAALNARGMEALEKKQPATAMRWFLRAARGGSANAMNNLGFLYERGWGALPSLQEALLWYERAAEAGHLHGMRNLARFYAQGLGVHPDAGQATYWRNRANALERQLAQVEHEGE